MFFNIDILYEEIELIEKMNEIEEKKKEDGVFRWEMFLPRKNVTVLLVESDRATRRLITSLLNNCHYKGSYCWILLSLVSY